MEFKRPLSLDFPTMPFFIPPQTKFEGYTVVTLSVCVSQNLDRGITSKVLKLVTSNFIHVVEKCSVKEP